MSCLLHFSQQQMPFPLGIGEITNLPTDVLAKIEKATPKEPNIGQLYSIYRERNYSLDAALIAFYFLESPQNEHTRLALDWFANLTKIAHNPKKVSPRVYHGVVKKFWSLFEKNPRKVLANLTREKIACAEF